MPQQLLENLKGITGRLLVEYLQKEVAELVDVRKIPKSKDMGVQAEARGLAVEFIEKKLIEKIRILNGDQNPPEENEYE